MNTDDFEIFATFTGTDDGPIQCQSGRKCNWTILPSEPRRYVGSKKEGELGQVVCGECLKDYQGRDSTIIRKKLGMCCGIYWCSSDFLQGWMCYSRIWFMWEPL